MPDYRQLFQDSYQRVVKDGGYNQAFIGRFYELFFAKSPAVAALFQGTNMSVQKTMLHDSLVYMAEFSRNLRSDDQIERIGRRHGRADLDIPLEFYDLWLDSLVEAVAERDPAFDADVALAWRVVLAPGVLYMKQVHERGR